MLITAAIIAVILLFVGASAAFWIDWLWFDSAGYQPVLITRYLSQAGAFLVAGVLAALFFAGNVRIAVNNGNRLALRRAAGPFGGRAGRWVLRILTLLTAYIAGQGAAAHWETWRLWLAGGSFGQPDPVFNRDVGFYVFQAPAYTILHEGALLLLGWTAMIVVLVYVISLGLERLDIQDLPRSVRQHVLVLLGVGLILVAIGYLLANFNLVYSTRGFATGPGFTDVAIVRPLNFVLCFASLAAAALMFLHAFRPGTRGLLIVGGVWLAAVLIGLFLPAVVQQAVVIPNELSQERPYIANNIAMTRAAFDLGNVEQRNLTGQGQPPADALTTDSPVLDNVRLWDYRVAQSTFRQLRSFVPYYSFPDVDVDRYEIDGDIRQVLVAARELDLNGLPANARVWVNQHLAYTHGYGMVVSPINEATSQGLPRFFVGDIPPEGAGPLKIDRPEIYFGELGGDWVAVNTTQQEVSGLSGETASGTYEGAARGSIQVSGQLPKILLALALGDRRILLSSEFSGDSKVLLRRSITERATAIVPFLTYDPDPYLVIADGRLVWVMDAYTSTNRYPNATPLGDGTNYLRHTVKVTVDAYDGTITFYRTGIPDPIADAYGRVYPDIFRPIAEAPQSLRDHFRYPEGIFNVQTDVYANYHVTDPDAFYNGEDRWQIAQESIEGETRDDDGVETTESYYMTLPLPGETDSSFKLVRTFTPNNRPNLTAWMAAQTDDGGVPRLVVYRFPRQSTIFGPTQVEARINQNPDIASRITLLDQAGSRVIRGNLLVIPIDQSLLYVQPLYLQATATEGAPTELQFVIVATNEAVVMRPTLEEALAAITGADGSATSQNVEGETAPVAASGSLDIDALTADAIEAYDAGQDALTRGDWQAYGEAQTRLKSSLDQIAALMRGTSGEGGTAIGTPGIGAPPLEGTPEPGS